MSQIWPDIPEFDGVPEVLRSVLWMRAYMSAIRRRTTWGLGFLGAVACAGPCGVVGHQVFGTIGAVAGGLMGLALAFVLFVRVTLEWQARRVVPAVRAAAGWPLGGPPNSGNAPTQASGGVGA